MPEGAPAIPPPTVLLVDDEPGIVELYRTTLAPDGYDIYTAHDGREAAELIGKTRFDAIVSDIAMPGLDGLQLLRHIREKDLDVPVILVTAGPNVGSAAQAIEYGALRYLAKPIHPAELRRLVTFAIDVHRMARAKREALSLVSGSGGLPSDRAGMEVRFEHALASISLAFQPIVSWTRKKTVGWEVYVRSEEPMLGRPRELIECCLLLGRIADFSRAVRQKVAEAIPKIPADTQLHMNLHPAELSDERLYESTDVLAPFASRVVFEFSERESLHQVVELRGRVRELRDAGFRIALDDLGVGHAGLQTFIVLEPDLVKLDVALIEGIETQEVRRNVVSSIVELCQKLEVGVITEGVETSSQLNAVLSAGGDLLEGYFFGRPAPTPETPKL